jgi:hypothetical protein
MEGFAIAGFLGTLVGTLIVTGLLTRTFNYLAQKKTTPRKAALIAFVASTVVTFLITRLTMWIITSVPCLILWLIIDYTRARKYDTEDPVRHSFKAEKAEPSIKSPNIFACTCCGAEYNSKDYRDDANEWLCAKCSKPLNKQKIAVG